MNGGIDRQSISPSMFWSSLFSDDNEMVGGGLYLIYPEVPEGVHGCVAFHQAAKVVTQYWIRLHRALRTGGGLPSSTISLCYHHYGPTEPVFQVRRPLLTRNSR